MSKSILYAANTNTQSVTVTTGTSINFGSIIRKYGCNVNLSGGNAVIRGCGYYAIDTNVNFTSGVAGTITVQLYKDGIAIPGAVSTISGVAADVEALTIPTLIRIPCDCESTITAVISGVTGVVNSSSIRIIKL